MKKHLAMLLVTILMVFGASLIVNATEPNEVDGAQRFALDEMVEIPDVCVFSITAIELMAAEEEGFQQLNFTLFFQNMSLRAVNLGEFLELELTFQNRFTFELTNPEDNEQIRIRPLVERSLTLTFELPNAALRGEHDELILSLSFGNSEFYELDVLVALGLVVDLDDMDTPIIIIGRNMPLLRPGRWMNLGNLAVKLDAVYEFDMIPNIPENLEIEESERFLVVNLAIRNLSPNDLDIEGLLSAELQFRERFVFEQIGVLLTKESMSPLEEAAVYIAFLVPNIVFASADEELWVNFEIGDMELAVEIRNVIIEGDDATALLTQETSTEPSQEAETTIAVSPSPTPSPTPTPTTASREIVLWNRIFIEIGEIRQFTAGGAGRENNIWLRRDEAPAGTTHNHVIYDLHRAATSLLATLHPHPHVDVTVIYRVYGDDKLLYTSPLLMSHVSPIAMNVIVEDVLQLKIEMEMTNTHSWAGRNMNNWLGIENARILTTEAPILTPTIPSGTREIKLWDMPFMAVGEVGQFTASETGRDNNIWLRRGEAPAGTIQNHVVYDLNRTATSLLAILHPHPHVDVSVIYRVYGDDELLYTSPILMSHILPINIDVSVEDVLLLKVEMEMTNTHAWAGRNMNNWLGIVNARIIIPE